MFETLIGWRFGLSGHGISIMEIRRKVHKKFGFMGEVPDYRQRMVGQENAAIVGKHMRHT